MNERRLTKLDRMMTNVRKVGEGHRAREAAGLVGRRRLAPSFRTFDARYRNLKAVVRGLS